MGIYSNKTCMGVVPIKNNENAASCKLHNTNDLNKIFSDEFNCKLFIAPGVDHVWLQR